MWGEENVSLVALLANSCTQIAQIAEVISQAKEMYDETKKYVGMAEDAVKMFNDAKRFGESIIKQPGAALENLFPDVGEIRREIESPANWGKGTGELQRRISVCLNGQTGCADFYERVSGEQAQEAISGTFGTMSPKVQRDDIRAMDAESANGLVGASVNEGRASVSREQYKALLSKCVDNSEGDVTSCQAAANMATILQASGTSDINEQLATANRLKAIDVANQSAEQKREIRESQQRADAVRSGFKDMAKARIVNLTDLPVESSAL